MPARQEYWRVERRRVQHHGPRRGLGGNKLGCGNSLSVEFLVFAGLRDHAEHIQAAGKHQRQKGSGSEPTEERALLPPSRQEPRHQRSGGDVPEKEDLDVVPDPWRHLYQVGDNETQKKRRIELKEARGEFERAPPPGQAKDQQWNEKT